MGQVAHLAEHRRRRGAEPSDAELVERALSGDERAFERLFRRHEAAVNRLAFRLCPREDGADDLVQDAFAQAFERLSRLRDPGAFGSWVRSIVVRTAAKRYRRAKVARRIGLSHTMQFDVDQIVGGAVPAEAAVELRRIYSFLHKMPGDAGVALILRSVEGLKIAEIAERMGVSEPTVKRRLKRAEALLEKGVVDVSPR